ncbi:unnamed protein product [marine sediment metagenome]|uniref:Uncharacterized protein n=1 Tax=marine sediment metagenome TaxID=412755 RepID=X1N904_9ZZZZ
MAEEEIPANCDVLYVKYHCDTLRVIELAEEAIAINNKPTSAVFPEGTVVIKELNIPKDKQYGYYTVRMSFTTEHPAAVWADLVDQHDKRIWKSAVKTSPATFIKSFHSGDLKRLKVRRFDSGKFSLTSVIFEVYWRPA